VLEERERSRKDRTLGQARLQYPVIHKHCVYDLELDTSKLSVEECARKVLDRMKSPPEAIYQMLKML
jgi:chloramphenicol 3-O phosphotransferase